MTVSIEAARPYTGSFIKFDGENNSSINLVVDASQYEKVRSLLDIRPGDTFDVHFEVGDNDKKKRRKADK